MKKCCILMAAVLATAALCAPVLPSVAAEAETEPVVGFWSTEEGVLERPIASGTTETYAESDRKWQGLPTIAITPGGRMWCAWQTGDAIEGSEGPNNYDVMYYSDDNGKTWSKEKLVVALKDRSLRPGMPVICKTKNGFFLCYEIVGTPCNDIYYKTSTDGIDFGDPSDRGTRAETVDGYHLGSMPFCVYSEKYDAIILNAKRDNEEITLNTISFLVNYNNGEGKWEKQRQLVEYDNRILQTGWSKGMAVIEDGTKLIELAPIQSTPTLMHISYAIANLQE